MNNYLVKVAEFNRVFGAPCPQSPQEPFGTRWQLRASLGQEELDEFVVACQQNDRTAVLDSLLDQMYILAGTINELGFQHIFDEGFDLVHQSNMSKSHDTLEEAEETKLNYLRKGIETYVNKVGDYYNVYRSSDDKVLKNINYQPVQLEHLV